MRMHKKIGRVVSGFLAALTLAASMPYAAAETDRQTIRVAFPTQEGMSFFGHSGKVTGYNYDYLEKISEYTGWEMEYVPYGSADGNEAVGSTLVTSLLPGQNMDADIAVSRDCDTQLLAAMNNYIYSISEDELAGYLSTGNLHPDSSSVLLFARRHPVQAMMAVTAVTALVAAIVVCLLLRASRQRAKMQAVHNRQLSQALQIARDANEAKTTFLSNMSHDIRTP